MLANFLVSVCGRIQPKSFIVRIFKKFNKLVRDKIPEIIEVSGKICETEILSEEEYLKINRPVLGETLEKLVNGIAGFHRNYPSVFMALEMFIAPGINDSSESLARFEKLVQEISPDAVQINTLDRPGVIDDLVPASAETMEKFAFVLNQIVPVTFVSKGR